MEEDKQLKLSENEMCIRDSSDGRRFYQGDPSSEPRPSMGLSLIHIFRARITGLFTILFLACMLLVYVIISSMVGQFLVDQRIVAQSQQVESFAATMGRTVFDRDAGAMYDAAVSQGKKMSGRVLILDTAGTVLADGFSELNGRVLQYLSLIHI